jgi:internalin A
MVKLNLSNNEIRDLGPLVKLIALEELNFNRNDVSSLAFVANMQKLRVLNCSTNLIEDISPLLDLPALTRVSLQGNPLSDKAKAHARELIDRGVTVIAPQ